MSDLKKYRKNLFLLGLVKIPMLFYVRPRLTHIDDDRVEVKIKLRRRTKNHLNSMYFGALAVGADVSAGIFAFYHSEKIGGRVSFAFKAMQCEFLQRAESDVRFICEEGKIVKQLVELSKKSGERQNGDVKVLAYNVTNEIVASFVMTVSVKVK